MNRILWRIQHAIDWVNEKHLRWALREMSPLHPELPEIVRHLHGIEARRAV